MISDRSLIFLLPSLCVIFLSPRFVEGFESVNRPYPFQTLKTATDRTISCCFATSHDDNDGGSTSEPDDETRRTTILSTGSLLTSLLALTASPAAFAVNDQDVASSVAVKSTVPSVQALQQKKLPVSCSDEEERRIQIFERLAPGVVFIDTFVEQRDVFSTNVLEVPLGSGSGFVWDKSGHIVTNFHVVRNAKSAQVALLTRTTNDLSTESGSSSRQGSMILSPASSTQSDLKPTSMRPGQSLTDYKRSVYKAKVIGVDPGKDVAVLKIDAPAKDLFPIELGTSNNLRVGQAALAIGNPFGLDHTLTSGIISGVGREVKSPTGQPISNVIQSDAAINPGNSGGPLLDSTGRLIGMNTAIYSPSGGSAGIGFAIPIDTVKYIVEILIRDGKVVRPVIGISYLQSKQARALGISRGVLVLDVPTDSPAYKAGMRGTRRTEAGLIEIGDIIVQVGETPIDTEADLFKALENFKPGDRVKITVSRLEPSGDTFKSKEFVLTVQLKASDSLPASMSFQDGYP